MARPWCWLGAGIAFAVLPACGAPPPGAGASGPEPTGTVTGSITSEGGTIRAVSDEGVVLTVDAPAGAVASTLELTLAPRSPVPGVLAEFGLSPPHITFDLPVALSVELPASSGVPEFATLALGSDGDRTYLATDVAASERKLTTATRVLGLAASAAASDASALRPASAHEAEVSATVADCRTQIASAQGTLDVLVATNAYEDAVRLILEIAGLAANCGLVADAEAWFDRTHDVACARYEDLALLSQTIAADSHDTFSELIDPLLAWAAQLQELAVRECSGPPAVGQLLAEKIDQFIAFLSSAVAESFTSEYEEILDELNKVWTMRGRASLLGLEGSERLLESQVLFPLMDLLRERGYERCAEEDDHYYLSALIEDTFRARRVPIGSVAPLTLSASGSVLAPEHHAAFADADLHRDLQYCASSVDVEVWDALPAQVTDESRQFDGGAVPGVAVDFAEAMAPIEGNLVLRGDVAAFRCGQSRTIASDALAIEFEGREADRSELQDGSMLQSPADLSVEELADLASFDHDAANTGSLVIVRQSDACGGDYGADRFELFTLDLTIDPKPSLRDATSSVATITADAETPVTFTLSFRDLGENLQTLAATFALEGEEQSFDVDVTASEDVAGFAAPEGDATYAPTVTVLCSEEGKNPLDVTFQLIDEFSQESDEISASMEVDYGDCGSATMDASGGGFDVRHAR